MKKIILFSLLVTSFSALAAPGIPSVPDAGSSAMLMVVAGSALAAFKRFKK